MERRPITKALATMLTTATGHDVSIIIAPSLPKFPYAILDPLLGGAFTVDFANTARQIQMPYQLTAVGQNYEQADLMLDWIRKAMYDNTIPIVTGTSALVTLRWSDQGPGTPDYTATKDICFIPERYTLAVDAP